jgi:hypothetical protein
MPALRTRSKVASPYYPHFQNRELLMRYLLAVVLLLGIGATGRVALADDTAAGRVERVFARLDANNDGRISRDEAKNGRRLARHFDLIDADKDGFITRAELTAFFDAHPRGKHGE